MEFRGDAQRDLFLQSINRKFDSNKKINSIEITIYNREEYTGDGELYLKAPVISYRKTEELRGFLEDKLIKDFEDVEIENDYLDIGEEGKELNEGESLAILDAGAYGFVMSSPYNSRPRPAEVLINNNSVYEIRKAETLEDLLKDQCVPEHLN